MVSKFLAFFAKSSPSQQPFEGEQTERFRFYRKLRMQSFVAGTIGYSLYYVCRTSLNVVKKPILESGALDAAQLGIIGSALLFAYAIGKFINGFLADHSNIKRFMAVGLAVSAVVNFLVGVFGFFNGAGIVGNTTTGLVLFIYGGNSMFVNVLSMIIFGIAIGVLISFLGGLMAIDLVPREATGAALGIVGMASYLGAGLQDIISGTLINSSKQMIGDVVVYDFGTTTIFWIGASVLSVMLILFLSLKKRIKQRG